MSGFKAILVIGLLIIGGVIMGDFLASGSSPDGLEWRFEYDDSGLLTCYTDAGGRRMHVQYDMGRDGQIDRLTKKCGDSTMVEIGFDNHGRRTQMKDQHGQVDYTYDNYGRLVEVCRDSDIPVRYAYDAIGRVNSMKIGVDRQIRYTYDFLGRVKAIQTPMGEITYDYDTSQRIVRRTLPNGIRSFMQYDADGRLNELTYVDNQNLVMAQYSYTFRQDNLISSITEWLSGDQTTITYLYDLSQRLARSIGYSVGFP
ncbi:hypothetical protein ACFLQW_04840 [Candidatus Zixiibacteriota bacterium]